MFDRFVGEMTPQAATRLMNKPFAPVKITGWRARVLLRRALWLAAGLVTVAALFGQFGTAAMWAWTGGWIWLGIRYLDALAARANRR